MILNYTKQSRDCEQASINKIEVVVYNPTTKGLDFYKDSNKYACGFIDLFNNTITYNGDKTQMVSWWIDSEFWGVNRHSLEISAGGWNIGDEAWYSSPMQRGFYNPKDCVFTEIWKGSLITNYHFDNMWAVSESYCGMNSTVFTSFRIAEKYLIEVNK